MSTKVQFATPAEAQDNLTSIAKYKQKFGTEIKSERFPILLRNSYGTKGIETEVGVNYFKYNVAGLKLYSYHVDLVVGSKIKTKLTVKQAIERYLFDLEPFKSKKSHIYYRGHNNIYSKTPLPIEDVVIYPIEKNVELKVRFVKELNFSDLIKYTQLNNYSIDLQETTEYTNALLSVIGAQVAQNKDVVGIGGNKFFLLNKSSKIDDLGKGLFVTMGTFASVRCSFDNIRINLNPTPAIFYKSHKPNGDPMNVLDLIQSFLNITKIPTANDIKRCESFLKGVKISRAYLNRRNSKSIQGINHKDNSNTIKFKDADDKLVTVTQYFKERWSINLKFPQLPLIKLGTDVYLPLELGIILPYQQYKGDLVDPSKIIKLTALRPNKRAELISQNNTKIFQKQVDFGEIDEKFTVVPARVLSAPSIEYAGNQKVFYREAAFDGRNEKKKGNWNLEKFKFVEAAKRARPFKFGVAILKNNQVASKLGDLQKAVPAFFSELARLGITVGKDFLKYSLDLNSPSTQTQAGMEQQLVKLFGKAKDVDKCDYLLVVLPSRESTQYSTVKRVCDLKVGILNGCVLLNVFIKKRRGSDAFDTMTFAQMAMKINIKLGGSNHKLSKQDSLQLVDKNNVPVFILGADVTHPTGQQNSESVSIASCVGSEDAIFNKFPGSIRIQEGGKEVIKEIKSMVSERLENFHKKVGKLPSKVLFYRDGVSEGQYYTVLRDELSQIKAAFVEYGKKNKVPGYSPTITFMIVVKRHHTRFIPLHENGKDPKSNKNLAVMSNDNVIPGTTIDKDITSPAFFDFYIQSQQALQGTGIPAHYYVLHDENNYTSDQIQQITYNLCHTFSRATKSVKIVPAAYYADLLCTRGRDYVAGFAKDESTGTSPIEKAQAKLGKNVAPNIRNTMYYI
ncbi:ago2 Protein argonaute-2 [Candida maltosa Xu316]